MEGCGASARLPRTSISQLGLGKKEAHGLHVKKSPSISISRLEQQRAVSWIYTGIHKRTLGHPINHRVPWMGEAAGCPDG